MTIMESIALVLLILVIAAAISYYVQMGQLPMKDMYDASVSIDKLPKSKAPQEPLEDHIEAIDAQFIKVEGAKKKKKYYPRKPKTHL
jgi:hypothetical protein